MIVSKTFINVNLPCWPPRHKSIVCNIDLIEYSYYFHDVIKTPRFQDNSLRLSLLLFEHIFKTLNKDLTIKYDTTFSKKI